MKFIKVILLTILCLNVGMLQANVLKLVTPLPNFTHKDIIESSLKLIDVLEKYYIFPEKSQIITKQLQYNLRSNKLNQINNLGQFIHELGIFVRRVGEDGYLNIIETSPQFKIGNSQSQVSRVPKKITSFGFEKIEILSGNIGYLKLDYFYQNPKAELKAAQVFDYLSETDAIIIDLRDVAGESISLAQYMMSFFIEQNTILTNVIYDKQTKTKVLKSAPNLSNDRLKHNFPVYILTSAFVSGTGEFFSYTLKHLGKALIVGEKTMGVAYISRKLRVDQFISITMPIAIPMHPVTKTNWEQEGVVPDFDVNADLSFDMAYKLAKEHLNIF